MGRAPCCDKANVKKGPWSPEEDLKLKEYIEKYGTGGNWIALPQKAGLRRCGKSCRLRWLNYLRPNIKHGEFSDDEDRIICTLFASIGSRWSIIAAQLPGRTDNDIKNYWNTKLKKKLMGMLQLQVMPPISQRKPTNYHQAACTFTSLLQNCSSSSLSSSPSSVPSTSSSSSLPAYNNKCTTTFYNTTQLGAASARSNFPCLEPSPSPSSYSSIPSTLLINSSCTNNTNNEGTFVGPMQMQHYQVKDQSFLMFGGDHQASCSSNSDGSSNNNNNHQIGNNGRSEIDQYGGGSNGGQMGLDQSYFYNNGAENGGGGGGGGGNNGLWGGETALMDYGLEEIKQLVSTNLCNNDYLVDENKAEERVIMYY